jgi:hypothetical protein
MSIFAKVVDGIVTDITVADQEFIDQLDSNTKHFWIETCIDTREGIHMKGGTPLRKNYACIGYSYDKERDAFIPEKLFTSWVLDEFTCTWKPPIPYPEALNGELYAWDEETQAWYETVVWYD